MSKISIPKDAVSNLASSGVKVASGGVTFLWNIFKIGFFIGKIILITLIALCTFGVGIILYKKMKKKE